MNASWRILRLKQPVACSSADWAKASDAASSLWLDPMKTLLVYAASWLGMALLAILNGAIREKVYGPFVGELSAHQLATLFALLLLAAYVWVLTGICPIQSSRQAFTIGGMWFVMTVLFEFFFGHYAMGHPWRRLFHDYHLLQGRVWSLVLIWTAIAPYVFYRIRS
jgi:hypothetical protein